MSRPLKIAYLPDPVKVKSKPGYPAPSVRDRLQREGGFSFEQITAKDLLAGCLSDSKRGFTLLCLPGGFAPNYDDKLGDKGARLIRQFVESGGGFVGLCAGAYYGSAWGIELLPVEVVDIDHWARGKGQCALKVAPSAEAALGLSGEFTVRYANGPMLGILDASRVAAMVTFETEFRGRKGKYPPIMKGSPAVVVGQCGNGTVVLVSPHIEDAETDAGREAFRRLFKLASASSGSGSSSSGGGSSGAASQVEEVTAAAVAAMELCQPADEPALPPPAMPPPFVRRQRSGGSCACDADCQEEEAEAGDEAVAESAAADAGTNSRDARADEVEAEEAEAEEAEAEAEVVVAEAEVAAAEAAAEAMAKVAAAPAAAAPVSLAAVLASLPLKVNIVSTQPASSSRPASSRKQTPGKQASKRAGTPPRGGGFQAAKSAAGGAAAAKKAAVLGAPAAAAAASAASRRPNGSGQVRGGTASVPPYLCHLSPSPTVLFTAPHGLRLRKGSGPGQCPRNHSRERWTSELVLKLAIARGQWESRASGQPRPPASFMIW